jgi:hypothetical protein
MVLAYIITALLILMAVAAVIMICVISFAASIALYANKLMMNLPWLKWLTLDDLVKQGYSKFYCKISLPLLLEAGNIDTRLRQLEGALEQEFLDEFGDEKSFKSHPEKIRFNPWTIKYHEFQLTKRGGRRKVRVRDIMSAPGLQPANI